MAHRVSTPAFEGPIDLLLHLVNSHEVDIFSVPLAPVVDEFVHHVTERRAELTLDAISEFLLVAAILLELKSQRSPGPTRSTRTKSWWASKTRTAPRTTARVPGLRRNRRRALTMAERRRVRYRGEVGLDEGFVVHAPTS